VSLGNCQIFLILAQAVIAARDPAPIKEKPLPRSCGRGFGTLRKGGFTQLWHATGRYWAETLLVALVEVVETPDGVAAVPQTQITSPLVSV
jgi:hypothetical protein